MTSLGSLRCCCETPAPAVLAMHDALTAYRIGAPTVIVARIADASFAAVANGRELVTDLRGVRASWNERIRARRNSNAWRVAVGSGAPGKYSRRLIASRPARENAVEGFGD